MKRKILTTLVLIQTLAMAGGSIKEAPYVNEDIEQAEAYVPVIEDKPEPVYIPPVVQTPMKDIKSNGLYAGIGITSARYDSNCNCPTAQPKDKTLGVIGRVGYDINQYIGVEARGLKTAWKDEGGQVEHYGAFIKPMIPVTKSTNVYGLLGAGKTKTKDIPSGSGKIDGSGFAWGAGVELDLSGDEAKEGRYGREFDGHGDQEEGVGVFVDYEKMVQKSNVPTADALSIGLTYDF